ncbi:MAG: hypothetical protein JNL65_02845 [Saprospiraceae bacterium]|nr:hypothetical protein [Saprospiraceae bacterium]
MHNLNYKNNKYLIYIMLACTFIACKETVFVPKPRMYPKISFPEYILVKYESETCPFKFQYASYANAIKDTSFFGEKPVNDCWINLQMDVFQGTLHCSYLPIVKTDDLTKYIKDSYKLAREHQIKANFIDEIPIHKTNHVNGILYNLEGPTASSFQFYLTDSSKHFLRASLYFNAQTRPDSMQPILDFVKKDVMTIINTFEWRY